VSKEIHTWFDIKPTEKELRRLADRGTKGNNKWYLDGTFVGTAKPNALRALSVNYSLNTWIGERERSNGYFWKVYQ
jgi:hypothetical protein